jgi:RNA polymerase sigma factor for flagellar operon FliA
MMTACTSTPRVDSPAVLARVREGLPLVEIICHQIRRQLSLVVRMDDLVSYGREGLLAAARSFDPERGVPFRRWANIRVRGAVIDGVRASSSVPRSVYARLRPVEGAEGVAGGSDQAPDLTLRAEEADRRLGEYLASAATAIALGFGADGANEPGEPMDRSPSVEETLVQKELFTAIRAAMTALPDAERTLLQRHYFDGVTFEQAAEELGLSKSWASRLHARAVEYVTRSLRRARWA